eukprot:4898297-Pyramimonas_sp.AAC.1
MRRRRRPPRWAGRWPRERRHAILRRGPASWCAMVRAREQASATMTMVRRLLAAGLARAASLTSRGNED